MDEKKVEPIEEKKEVPIQEPEKIEPKKRKVKSESTKKRGRPKKSSDLAKEIETEISAEKVMELEPETEAKPEPEKPKGILDNFKDIGILLIGGALLLLIALWMSRKPSISTPPKIQETSSQTQSDRNTVVKF
ncbi:MAG: hypothetical protein QXI16_00020 [Sulfolobaceae archaeon]